MKNTTWIALIIISFLISWGLGLAFLGLYVFNYVTYILHGLWLNFKFRGDNNA